MRRAFLKRLEDAFEKIQRSPGTLRAAGILAGNNTSLSPDQGKILSQEFWNLVEVQYECQRLINELNSLRGLFATTTQIQNGLVAFKDSTVPLTAELEQVMKYLPTNAIMVNSQNMSLLSTFVGPRGTNTIAQSALTAYVSASSFIRSELLPIDTAVTPVQ
jgi:hypothetical protein